MIELAEVVVEYPILEIKAKRIVCICSNELRGKIDTIICFGYKKEFLKIWEQQIGEVVQIRLDDSNGRFLSDEPRRIFSARAPNRNTFGVTDDVMIIETVAPDFYS